jgi:DNA polymerase
MARAFDRTNKPEDEPYYQTGITTFGQPPATARKTGKTGTLAFQYQGGIGAYRRITGDGETPDEIIAAHRDAWRRDHPEHARFWGVALLQAVQAIQYPGQEFTAQCVAFQFDRGTGFLEVKLPSERRLTYPQAQLFEDEQRDTVSFTFLDASGSRTGRMYHERRGSGAFGGLLLENITQALCRDIFVEVMPRLEAAGYSIVAHTHDEYCCEVPEDFGSLDEFLALSASELGAGAAGRRQGPHLGSADRDTGAEGRSSNRHRQRDRQRRPLRKSAGDRHSDNRARACSISSFEGGGPASSSMNSVNSRGSASQISIDARSSVV